MGIQNFRIIFDKPMYMVGDDVTGRAVLSVIGKDEKIRSIKIQVSGISSVTWWEKKSEGHGKNKKTVSKKKVHNEVFYTKQVFALEKGEHVLTVGDHEIVFNISIPDTGVQGTFKSKEKGEVLWQAKGEIDVPWGFDKNAVESFCVNSLKDLNLLPQTIQPFDDAKQKTYGTLCCESGPLEVSVNIPKSGFVCGEVAPINIRVDNNSNKNVTIIITLIQKTTYARLNQAAESEELQKQVVQKCSQGTNETLCHNMKIMPCAPSTNGGSGILDIEYFFQIDADPDGIGFNLTILVPITIGNVPHKNTFQALIDGNEDTPDSIPILPEGIRSKYPGIPNAKMAADKRGIIYVIY